MRSQAGTSPPATLTGKVDFQTRIDRRFGGPKTLDWRMLTFVLFVLLVAVLLLFAGYEWCRRLAAFLGDVAYRVLAFLGRGVSRFVDLVLSSRGVARVIPQWRIALFAAITFSPVAVYIYLMETADPRLDWLAVPVFLGSIVLFAVIVMVTALLITYEDYDVMDGLVRLTKRRFKGSLLAKRQETLLVICLIFFIYTTAIIHWFDGHVAGGLFIKKPDTGSTYVDYVLMGLLSMPPMDLFVKGLSQLASEDVEVVYRPTLISNIVYWTVYSVVSVLLLALIAALVNQAWQLKRIVGQVPETDETQLDYLIERAKRAPSAIKRGILRNAISNTNPEVQRKYIIVACKIETFTFPQTFCYNLRHYDHATQAFGLERIGEFVRSYLEAMDRVPKEALLQSIGYQLTYKGFSDTTRMKLLKILVDMLTLDRVAAYPANLLKTLSNQLNAVRRPHSPELRALIASARAALQRAEKASS
jgi:hypothetical protein